MKPMKRDDVFERLEPPPGGLAELRERMSARRPSAVRRFAPPLAVAFAVAAAVLLFLFWRPRNGAPDLVAAARQHGGQEEAMLGLAPALGSSAALTADARSTTALAEVPTGNPAVSFYWVSSTAWAD